MLNHPAGCALQRPADVGQEEPLLLLRRHRIGVGGLAVEVHQ